MLSCKKEIPESWDKEDASCWRIRTLEKPDLGAVLSIERVSFPTPWSESVFRKELENPLSRCWVIEGMASHSSEGVWGYLCVWIVVDEMHIMNLATHPSHRRRGIARKLLCYALEQGQKQGVEDIVLEVRPSNHAAQKLYWSVGFRAVGRRLRYYQDTGEDAIIMVKKIRQVDEDSSDSSTIYP